jgi:hypothetical protein
MSDDIKTFRTLLFAPKLDAVPSVRLARAMLNSGAIPSQVAQIIDRHAVKKVSPIFNKYLGTL